MLFRVASSCAKSFVFSSNCYKHAQFFHYLKQPNTTRDDRKSVQEVSKRVDAPRPAEACAPRRVGFRSGPVSKTHVNYWKKHLLRNSFTRDGELHEVAEFCVKIQHLGRRQTFSLGTDHRETAATKAREIYLTIIAKGWDAAQTLFNPGMLVRKDDPTLGEFFAEVQAKAGLSAKTFRNYASAFRTIASASAPKLANDQSKYDYRGGGQQQWLTRVDAIKLSAMTPDRVQQWKLTHIKKAGTSLSAQVTARRTVNSYIRCARSLFSKRVLKFVKVRLPTTLPFEGIELEQNVGDMRYKSKIKAKALVDAAKEELRAAFPESYKAFLLGLFCGLRRSEIDLLEWTAMDWQLNQIAISATDHFEPKTDGSEDFVEVDPEVMAELQSYFAASKSPFVLNSPLPPRTGLDRQYYRCQQTFKHLTDWLRLQGVTANKPIHELRKEFGSLVNAAHGIYAASRALRHSDITTSARHYIAKKQRTTVGLGHLLGNAEPTTESWREPTNNRVD